MAKDKGQAYTVFSMFYDEIMKEVPYDEWVIYLEDIFREINYIPLNILDLACGTGNITLRLAQRGYKVSGIDGSLSMIEQARKKTTKAGYSIDFFCGDFRTFEVLEPYDLIICLYDSLNYLLTEEDLYRTFQRVNKALINGGYFIFDMNTIKRLKSIEEDKTLFEGEGYFCFWKNVVDPLVPLWKVFLTFFIEGENGEYIRRDEVHTERGYSLLRVEDLLFQAGFVVEKRFDAYTLNPGDEDSDRVFWVVKKVDY